MNIKRTLLVSPSQLGEELISALNKELLLTYGKEYSDLLMKKVGLIKVHKDSKISLNNSDKIIDTKNEGDSWDIPAIYQAYAEKESEIVKIFREAETLISSGEDDVNLSKVRKTDVDDKINIIVLLPVYKPAESVFLPFIIEKVFFKLGIPEYNYHFLGLLPDLDDEKDVNYNARAYACISECEKILSEKQDLINSFALLSCRNEKNIYLGGLKDIFPTLQEYLSMSFFNHQTITDIRSGLTEYRKKIAFFSSWGFSTFAYKKDRFNKHFENRFTVKTIDEFFASFEKPVERDLFFTDLDQLVGELKWADKNKLLEDQEGYSSFSKQRRISNALYKEDTKDSLVGKLNEAQNEHENTHHGYYRKDYLASLSKNMANRSRESQRIIIEKIKLYLSQGLEGVKKAYALTFALLGKDESGIFKGRAAIDPINLRTAREEIAEFYKNYLPEDERISLADIKSKESAIKSKQEESEKLLRKIENLEIKLFGKIEELSDIEESEEKLYFTIDGQKVNISGARDMDGPIPESITPYEHKITGALPKIIDLRPFMTPVEDQQQVGSCTANAVVGAYEYLIKRGTEKIKDFSRLFVYYNGREKGGYANEDRGSAICYCTESMMEKGVCLESTWDYLPEKVNEKPSPKAFEEANNYKVIVAEHFDTELDSMRKCLAEGYPFVLGLKLYKSFQKASAKGIVPIPDSEDTSLEKHGLHAMLCVGYSDEEKCFIVRNSWGEQWGDKGYCYIPYEYLASKEHRCTEKNFLLKTISDVNINEKELVKNIGKDSGSLFNFSYDIHDLNAYKENREKLKAELESMIPELEELRRELTRQRERVLMQDFRSDAEDQDVKSVKEEQEKVVEEIEKVEKLLSNLKEERNRLIEEKKRVRLLLFVIYPALGLAALIVLATIPVLIWSWFDVLNFILSNILTIIKLLVAGLIIYGIWAIVKYKKTIINKLNEVQDEINSFIDKRNALITKLIGLYDKYFEVRRIHKLHDVFYNFILNANEQVESIKINFEEWLKSLSIQKDKLLNELPDEELVDSNIVFNAVSESNLNALIRKQNVVQDYYQNGKKPMDDFFMDENQNFLIQYGVNFFLEDIIDTSKKNHIYTEMQKFSIYDFLFDNEMLLGFFPEITKRPLDEKIDIFVPFCSPFIKIITTTDKISPSEQFELQLPKDDSDNSKKLIAEVKKRFGRANTSEYDNRNPLSSSIVFFYVKSALPAFILEPIREGFQAFRAKDKNLQQKLHIDKEFSNYSCIPDDIKEFI